MPRYKEYDIDVVLDKALNLFWLKGYNQTSLADLVEVTGLKKGSLYSEFSSKEELYKKALSSYRLKTIQNFFTTEENPRNYLKNFFSRLIDEALDSETSKGCFILNSNIEFCSSNCDLSHISKKLFIEIENNFFNVVKDLVRLKYLDKSIDQDEFHSLVIGCIFSIREMSRFKQDRKFLTNLANGVLKYIGDEI